MNSLVLSESQSFWPRFKGSMKRKNKKQSSKPSPSSNYAVEISPNLDGKSAALVRIGSISRDGEFIPVILSPAGKANERQVTKKKKKKALGFSAAEIKVKSRDAEISVKPDETEVCTQELGSKQISEQKAEVAMRKLNRRSWVRIAKVFRFSTALDLHQTNRNRSKVSQDSHLQVGHSKDTEAAVIEQQKGQEIQQENEVADSIPEPIDEPCKSSRILAKVDCRSQQKLKSIDLHKKVNSHASAPNTPLKRRGIKSVSLCSSSSYKELPRLDMNSYTASNSQPKKLSMLGERKGTITAGNATGEAEGYNTAINFSVLIIIVGCLAVFSDRLLAVVCTSLWWYLLPSLLKRNRVTTVAASFNGGRSDLKHPIRRKLNRSLSDVSAAIHKGGYQKKEGINK